MELLIVCLIASIALNYIVITAYIEQNKKYRDYEKVITELEKVFGNVEKLVSKHSKTFKKGK